MTLVEGITLLAGLIIIILLITWILRVVKTTLVTLALVLLILVVLFILFGITPAGVGESLQLLPRYLREFWQVIRSPG